jgi:hypothetical protein
MNIITTFFTYPATLRTFVYLFISILLFSCNKAILPEDRKQITEIINFLSKDPTANRYFTDDKVITSIPLRISAYGCYPFDPERDFIEYRAEMESLKRHGILTIIAKGFEIDTTKQINWINAVSDSLIAMDKRTALKAKNDSTFFIHPEWVELSTSDENRNMVHLCRYNERMWFVVLDGEIPTKNTPERRHFLDEGSFKCYIIVFDKNNKISDTNISALNF